MPAPRKSLERQNLTTQIYAQLADDLMTGRLVPGQTMLLRELAEQFGVSQTPAREALLQLVSEGALEMTPNRSIHVPQPCRESLTELRELRVLLECYAGRTAALKATPTLVASLRAIHAELMAAMKEGRSQDILATNKEFHFGIYQCADMPTTLSVIRQLWMRMAPYLNYLYNPRRPDLALIKDGHPHEMILEGLATRDPGLVHQGIETDLRYLQPHLDSNLAAILD